jgi:glycerol uptake facilitator protein
VLSWFGYSQRSFAATEDEGGKLACLAQVQLSKFHSNLISEIIGTFVLIFVIFLSAGPDVSIAVAEKIGFHRLHLLQFVWAID